MRKFVSRISFFVVILFIFTMMFSGVAGSVKAEGNKVKVLIQFTESPGESEKALIRAFGGDIDHVFSIVPGVSAEIPESAIFGLSKNPKIVSIEPNLEVYSIGEIDSTWGVNHIGAGEVHAGGNTGAGVKVAVLDSGINYNHTDLDANYKGGWDFVNNDDDPMDDNGHGTHVAGTIAAEANGVGVVGVAPDAELYALKVLGADGSGYFSWVVEALEWCMLNGIQVTNASLGSSSNPGDFVENAYIAANAAGIINISSAGNEGKRNARGDNVGYPGAYASVVAVAATDINDNRASFSSTGPDVEISAPGVNILSTYQDGYGTGSGTSMASPHVAGVAALMIKAGITSPDAIRSALQETAIDLGTPGRDWLYGYGLVDAAAAVGGTTPVNQSPVVTITAPADGSTFDEGTSVTFTGTANDAEDGTISSTISWSTQDGPLGTGESVTTVLGLGTHTITATVTDSGGLPGSDSITVTIEAVSQNQSPAVTITAPADGSSFDEGTSVTFSGTATDAEDGDLSSSISWTSSIDGVIGAGSSFSNTLSVGIHTITASVTDSGGASASDSITVTVEAPPGPEDTVSISSITFSTSGGRNKDAHLEIDIGLEDETGAPVPGAVITINLYYNGSLYAVASATTDSSGIAPYKFPGAPSGTYVVDVVDVNAPGFVWDGSTPVNNFPK
jgi:hypothetical protein